MTKTKQIISLCIKAVIVISSIIGIVIAALAGKEAFMGGGSVFMFFTIQSNILMIIISIIGAILSLLKKPISRWMYVVRYSSTIAITLTGFVFCVMLAPTLGKFAWNLTNVLTHVVVPVLSIADFFIVSKEYQSKKYDPVFVLIPPLAYIIYAGIGFAANWEFMPGLNYPYFFLNWGSPAGAFGFSENLPFIGCVYWIILIGLFLIGIGYLYLHLLKVVYKKKIKFERHNN